MKILVNEKISQHKYKTPEGYLICVDSVLARTGPQTYRKNELFVDSEDDSEIEVGRSPEEVFSAETLASFENKPITVEHPDEDVNIENYKDYSVGFVRDVKQGKFDGQDVILGTLVITDKAAIEGIENGEHVELSCGYDCDIEDGADGYQQKRIRGNHVALCEAGRAGIAKIVDSVVDEDTVKYKGYTLKFHKGYNMWVNMKDYYEVFDERGNKVAMKKDLKSAKEYVDNGGFKDSIEDDYNYDIETNFDKILYDLTANNIDYSSAAYDTQLIWFKDDAEYEKAKKYLDRKHWKYKKGVNKKGVKYFEIKDAVKDKDYGGAFDLDPESYFSRDDLIDFEDELERKLGHKARTRAYVDGTTLSVDYEMDGESFSQPAEVKIDMRKIKRPRDLIKNYLEPIRKIIEKEYKESFGDSMKDANHLPPKLKNEIKQYLGRISTFVPKSKKDWEAKDFIDDMARYFRIDGTPLKFTRESVKGWNRTGDGTLRKDYVFSVDGYDNKFLFSIYANDDYETTEVNAYFMDSVKDASPFEKIEKEFDKQHIDWDSAIEHHIDNGDGLGYFVFEGNHKKFIPYAVKIIEKLGHKAKVDGNTIDVYDSVKDDEKSDLELAEKIKLVCRQYKQPMSVAKIRKRLQHTKINQLSDEEIKNLAKKVNIYLIDETPDEEQTTMLEKDYDNFAEDEEVNDAYKPGDKLQHIEGDTEVVKKIINEETFNGKVVKKYLMKSGKKYLAEDIETDHWHKVTDSIYAISVQGQKSKKLVRAKDAREAIDKYAKIFPKDKIKSVKKTDKFNNIIDIVRR